MNHADDPRHEIYGCLAPIGFVPNVKGDHRQQELRTRPGQQQKASKQTSNDPKTALDGNEHPQHQKQRERLGQNGDVVGNQRWIDGGQSRCDQSGSGAGQARGKDVDSDHDQAAQQHVEPLGHSDVHPEDRVRGSQDQRIQRWSKRRVVQPHVGIERRDAAAVGDCGSDLVVASRVATWARSAAWR